jgi:pilus assembly protein CpaE
VAEIRVLLVEQVEQMRRMMETALSWEGSIRVVGQVSSGQDALEFLRTSPADVAVVSEGLADQEAALLVGQMTELYPDLPVVIIGPSQDLSMMRRFMTAGARGYVNRPVDFQDLRNSIRAVHQSAQDERLARLRLPGSARGDGAEPGESGFVVAVFAGKGGVGKTALAVNLAVWLQTQFGGRACLVDADFAFGDSALHLDLNPRYSVYDWVNHVDKDRDRLDPDYLQSIMAEHSSGLRVLCRPPRPEHAEMITAEHMQRLLALLPTKFTYVVVDCMPSYEDRILTILDHTDLIVLMVTPEMGAITSTTVFLDLAKRLGYKEEQICIVMNRAHSGVGIEAEDVRTALGRDVDFSVPTDGPNVSLSVNRGVPLSLRTPKGPFSQHVFKVAEYVASLHEDEAGA